MQSPQRLNLQAWRFTRNNVELVLSVVDVDDEHLFHILKQDWT